MCILANVNLMFVHWYLYIWLWAGAKLTASIIPASTFWYWLCIVDLGGTSLNDFDTHLPYLKKSWRLRASGMEEAQATNRKVRRPRLYVLQACCGLVWPSKMIKNEDSINSIQCPTWIQAAKWNTHKQNMFIIGSFNDASERLGGFDQPKVLKFNGIS